MKPAHPLLKIATLSVFAVMICGFVAYRTGKLNGLIGGDRSALGERILISVDSPAKDSVVKTSPVIMSSSKSMHIPNETYDPIVTDTGKSKNKPKPPANNNNNANQAPLIIMGSSKSGPVFVPKPVDTAKQDIPQQQQQQNQQPKK